MSCHHESPLLTPEGECVYCRTEARAALRKPAAEAPIVTVPELPAWCRGVSYRAADDVITAAINVPASGLAHAHVLACEMVPEAARALVEALTLCLNQSAKMAQTVDAEPAQASPSKLH